jgi:hypothetical protein
LALPNQFALGRGALPAGSPLPNGNANNGLTTFRNEQAPNGCVLCHTFPSGLGTDMQFNGKSWVQIPPGTNSDHHIALVALARDNELPFKIPQLRNLFDKTGMDMVHTNSELGFGFFHDGGVDSLVRFVQDSFSLTDDQETADLIAFLFAFSGSNLPLASGTDPNNAPGVASLDTPAATGFQITISNAASAPVVNTMISLATSTHLDLVVKGRENGQARGWFYLSAGGYFQSDRLAETETPAQLLALAAPGSDQTYTLAPSGSGERIGIDRDADGIFDQDELDAGSNPANPLSVPSQPPAQVGGISLAFGTNGVALNWYAVKGSVCQLEYKNNLTDPVWTIISTNTANIGALSASDPSGPTNTGRYYRIVAAP